MQEFHSSKWENRNDIKNKFRDEISLLCKYVDVQRKTRMP